MQPRATVLRGNQRHPQRVTPQVARRGRRLVARPPSPHGMTPCELRQSRGWTDRLRQSLPAAQPASRHQPFPSQHRVQRSCNSTRPASAPNGSPPQAAPFRDTRSGACGCWCQTSSLRGSGATVTRVALVAVAPYRGGHRQYRFCLDCLTPAFASLNLARIRPSRARHVELGSLRLHARLPSTASDMNR